MKKVTTGRFRSISHVCIGAIALAQASGAFAQEQEFADDFSRDSVSWSTNGNGTTSARGEVGAIVLQAESTTGSNSQRWIPLRSTPDSASITGTLDATTSLGTDFNDQARLRLTARIMNDIAAGGDPNHPQGNDGGNISFGLDYYATGDGNTGAIVCFGREGENGFVGYNVFEGNDFCSVFEQLAIPVGSPVTLAYSLVRETNTLTLSVNSESLVVTFPGEIFEAYNPYSGVEVESQNTAKAIARVTGISTPTQTVDFTGVAPIVDRYRPVSFDERNPGSLAVVNGQAEITAVSADDGYSSTKLSPQRVTDYLEAELMLSSDSDIGTGRLYAQLEGELYNDTAEGGTDGRLGNVRSIIELRVGSDGQRNVEYCLFRSDDSEFDARTGLLSDGNRCETFPTRIEMDTSYRVAMALDRAASTLTFKLDGFEYVHNITTGIFDNSNRGYDARIAANDGATAVGTIDNLRTAAAALTTEEQTANLSVPPVFPEPVDPASQQVENTLTAAAFDWDRDLTFVDDFSDPDSTAMGYWSNSRTGDGESAVQFIDGALELQANSVGNDDDNSTYSELYFNGRTDKLRAKVSLRSNSILPPDPDAEADIRIRAVFHNDIQDYGTNTNREGDIPVTVRLRLEGDGRLRASYYLGRRDVNGDWQDYDIIDGENGGRFDVPNIALDTVYELGMAIDREQSLLTVSLDEQTVEIPLPGAAYLAHSAEAVIQVSHRGTSGRAVGRIYSVETDNYQRDFTTGPGTLGPYAPVFSARNPGQEVAHENGRLKLVSDQTRFEQNSTALFLAGGSSYTGAEVMLSSESTISVGSSARAGIGATLFNDLEAGGGNEGRTYAEMHIEAEAEGAVYAEYCLIRSNDDSFSDTTELITGAAVTDGPLNCMRFDQPVALDMNYSMSIDFDRDRSTIVFTLGSEQHEYNIATSIFEITRPFNAIIVHASDMGRTVGYFNSFSTAGTPVQLPVSGQTLVLDDGGMGIVSSGGSSSGCSIGGKSTGASTFVLLTLMAFARIWRRRHVRFQR